MGIGEKKKERKKKKGPACFFFNMAWATHSLGEIIQIHFSLR